VVRSEPFLEMSEPVWGRSLWGPRVLLRWLKGALPLGRGFMIVMLPRVTPHDTLKMSLLLKANELLA